MLRKPFRLYLLIGALVCIALMSVSVYNTHRVKQAEACCDQSGNSDRDGEPKVQTDLFILESISRSIISQAH
jgi:hypothetical protein